MKTIGIIGMGSIGSRHAKNLKELGHHVIGYDLNEPSTTLDNTLAHSDAIIIASPTKFHAQHMHNCHHAKKPYFVEKPISDLDMSSWGNDIPYLKMVGYNLRFHPCVMQAKEWIERGFIGKNLWANLAVAQHNTKYTDSVILNWSHEIDLALYLLGGATVTTCAADKEQTLADIVLRHDSGCQTTIHLDYVTRPEIRQTILVGTGATIILDLVNRSAWLRGVTGEVLDQFSDESGTWNDDYMAEMAAFIDRLDGKTTIGCTGIEGLEVLKVCLKAQELSQ